MLPHDPIELKSRRIFSGRSDFVVRRAGFAGRGHATRLANKRRNTPVHDAESFGSFGVCALAHVNFLDMRCAA